MKTAQAITKYVRISPRKARLASELIVGMPVETAMLQLKHCNLRGGIYVLRTLESAVANAETQLSLRRENLKVGEARVDAGPILKRAKPKNKGGRHPIMKRTSHFVVVVKEA